jgi:hypothetical protein
LPKIFGDASRVLQRTRDGTCDELAIALLRRSDRSLQKFHPLAFLMPHTARSNDAGESGKEI